MTTKHSLFTRSLAVLLAMIMVISNMSGLTITAKAAEKQLFDVIAESENSSAALNSVLSNPAALPKLAALNVAVDVPGAPAKIAHEEVDGKIALPTVDGWYPAIYNAGAGDVKYEAAFEVPANVKVVNVTYKNDVANKGEILNYIAGIQESVVAQRAELNNVANSTALKALDIMDYDFIQELIDAVQALTVEDLGIEAPTPEDFDIDVDFLVENDYIDPVEYFDYDQDGDQDEDDKAAIDAEIMADPAYTQAIQDAIDDAIEDELADTKKEYVVILGKLIDRLVDGDNMYMDYVNDRNRPIYQDNLIVAAMLIEYDKQGLYHYYQNAEYINSELKELSATLYEILGEPEGNGYANDSIINALLVEMDQADVVDAADLANMAQRMKSASANLPNYLHVLDEIDMSNKDAVDHLFFAAKREEQPLIAQVNVSMDEKVTLVKKYPVNVAKPVAPTEPEVKPTEPAETEPAECAHEGLVHMEAVEPACHFDGNIEYWVCYECETVWQNAELTQLTNIKNVVLPALGGEVVHVEAVEPSCYATGNIEHWYCESCEQVWQNEALTQLTNHKNVILPETHQSIVHVPAVAPTTEAEGNIEYWYCDDCQTVWQDEALMQLTNFKNVILPKAEGNTVDTAIAVEFIWAEDGVSATATLTVQPGAWYYSAYGIGGMNLTVNGKPAELTSGMFPMAPSTFFIANTGIEAAEYVVEVSHPVGSYMNPAPLYGLNEINVSLEAGNSQGYYLMFNNMRAVGQLKLTLAQATAGTEVDVILTNLTSGQMAWMTDSEDGTVAVEINPFDQVRIQVAVMPDANWAYPASDVTLKGEIVYPVGSMMNPAALAEGVNNAEIAAGNDQGYFYNWTAPAAGTLVLTMPEGNWLYVANNLTTYAYGDMQWSDSDPVVNPGYVLVEAGDQIEVIVNNYDPENPFVAPAGTLSFTAEFVEPVDLYFGFDGAINTFGTYKVGHCLTEEEVKSLAADLKLAKPEGIKVFDEEGFIAEYTGYQVTGEEILNVELKYAVTLDGEEVLVPADDNFITIADLGFEADGHYIIVVNGSEMLIDGLDKEFEIDIVNGNNVIEIKEFVSRNRLYLLDLAAHLNEKSSAGYYEVTTGENGEDVLIANLSLGQLSNFGLALYEADLNGTEHGHMPVKLNGRDFIFGSTTLVNVSAVVSALLEDDQFSSEALIAVGEAGKGEILHATMSTGDGKCEFTYVLNLTSTPAEMAKVTKALKAARGHLEFTAGNGYLDVTVNVPEEAYEAYTAYALLTGRMTKEEITQVKNMNGLAYVERFMDMLHNEKITGETFENTLRMLFVDRNVDKYVTAYNYLKTFVNDDAKFTYTLDEKTSTVMVNMYVEDEEGVDVEKLVKALLGIELADLGEEFINFDDFIETDTHVTFVNDIPTFQAAIIDPARLNDAGKYNKLQAIDLTENLAAENIQSHAAVMLFADVYGDVTFNGATILDLNGKTIHGNVKSNKGMIIMDSSIETVSGGGVTGTVSGSNIAILSGTYASNVEARLQDGYYQDANGAVKHALYTVENGKILVDSGLYRANVDGLLPAVHCIAAQVALDTVLNYYFTGALYAEGKNNGMGKLYDVNFEDLVYMIGAKDAGYIIDEILDLIDVAALSDFINKIIADLINIDKIAASVNNGGTIASYQFELRPWDGTVRYEADGDYITVDIEPSAERARKFNLSLGLDLPTGADVTVEKIDKTISIQDLLDELARIVVTTEDVDVDYTELEVNLYQPVRNGKVVTIGGDAQGTLNLTFAHNTNYNRILGAALAYFDEDLTMKLVKDGCIVDLNEAMHDITIGQLFDTINQVVQNKEIPFEKIASKLKLDLTDSQLAKLEKAYDMFQNGVAKVMNKFDLADIAATPLSDLVDNDGRLVFDADLQPHYADAFYKGFGVAAELGYSKVKVILTFANDHQPGEPVREYICKCSYDLVTYCELCGIELSREQVRGLWGDANCNGIVDNIDAMLIAQYDVDLVAEPDIALHHCDVNGDGVVDNIDAMLVAQYDVDIITVFPVEEKK